MSPELQGLLAETLRVPVETIRPEAACEDIGLDSLAMAELSIELEKRYGPEAAGERRLLAARTVGEISALLEPEAAQ